ncbi:MAG TPA: excinuclease ABC subunit UvrA [Fastidiosipila sp.]|nr:excinuclease ABC subunit UvrA [Eubacteriales bacterium]HHU04482.1 excinuclease ABC subunit UvrA [Fastidiosipila sp.]
MNSDLTIRGAREHNLKDVSLTLPRNQMIVFTGISGSGKSSLAFDTIYAEGQRRYVESLSSYARQFLGQSKKPDVDSIDGLSPAIAIDQKTTSKNPRSTVGTVTEIYDYLRLLYARAGTPHCPQCGRTIERQTVDQILDIVMQEAEGTRLNIFAPVVRDRKGEHKKVLDYLRGEGFVRVRIDGVTYELEEEINLQRTHKHVIEVVVDRLILREDIRSRLADSLETALRLADGLVMVRFENRNDEGELDWREQLFSQNFSCPDCQISIGEISPGMFSFNNPYGACPECTGLGIHTHIDPELILADPELSLEEGAISAIGFNFKDNNSWARAHLNALAEKYKFSLKTPWKDLPQKIKDIVMFGGDNTKITVDTSMTRYDRGEPYHTKWSGVVSVLERRYKDSNSGDIRDYYDQYLAYTECSACQGGRLRPESLAVTVGDLNIKGLTDLSVSEAHSFLQQVEFPDQAKAEIAEPVLREIKARLQFMLDVGLEYLTLSRGSASLSGGEAQRIRLATQIGSGLTGVLYVLDEPSIGLHQRDNARLLRTLKNLRDLGNTVIVVEHDEETIWEADTVVDIGPGAGEYGGHIVSCGRPEDIAKDENSITGQYLSGKKTIAIPLERRPQEQGFLKIYGAAENNLKEIDVSIPLGNLVCITGVSGSGKSSLANEVLLKKLEHDLQGSRRRRGKFDRIEGIEQLDKVISIDQSPIGRTPRSNPATYTGTFDMVRKLFAETPEAKARGYKPGRFSFNVKGGRCEACKGDGVNRIEMHFLPDVYVTCEVCDGLRYNRETLEVRYKGKNISDVLELTVKEGLEFFQNIPSIARKLQTLLDVGLGYIRLGQSSTQLSGGEAQRIKLATELSKRDTGKTFYILDEPTTGLHAADVHNLIDVLHRLVESGNTVLIIEHNLDIIKTADYIIDLGPEGGENGGFLVAAGTPEEIAENNDSYTGLYLAQILKRVYPTVSQENIVTNVVRS